MLLRSCQVWPIGASRWTVFLAIPGSEDGSEGLRAPTGGRKAECATWMCTYPLGIGQWGKRGHNSCSAPALRMRLRDWIWRREERIKVWRLPTCFLSRCGFPSGWLWGLELRQRTTVIIYHVFCTLAFSVVFSLCLVWSFLLFSRTG